VDGGLKSIGLDALFNPISVAVIGASADPRKVSGRPLRYLKSRGYQGPVYPINPRRSEVQGVPALPSLAAAPGPVDQALNGLPAASVPDAVETCVAAGVRSIVLFSGGFGETDSAGLAAEERIARRCADAGVRLLGPNCLGYASFHSGAYGTISQSLENAAPEAGSIAIVSQSGAVGTYALVKGMARGMKFSRFAATGNEADVDVASLIAWLAHDPQTKVIAGYLESCRDGRRLAAALEIARAARKPVVLLKAGASEAGSAAAASHTGALAGADPVYDAVFRGAGAARAHSIDEMLDIACAASLTALPAGRSLGVVTVSGGFGIMLADAAAGAGIDLPPLTAAARTRIKAAASLATPANPVDLTTQVQTDMPRLVPILDALLDGGQFDAVVGFFGTMGLDPAMLEALRSATIAARRRHPGQLLALCMMADAEIRAPFEAAGIFVLEDPERLVTALAQLAGFREAFDRPARAQRSGKATSAVPLRGPISEAGARRLLAGVGIPFAPEQLAQSVAEAKAAAEEFAKPVAMKIVSADIAHKSDIGGVLLDVTGSDAAADAFDTLMRNARAAHPRARIDGVSVAPMIRGGVETVMGVSNDPAFGPVVMFGLGGIHAEVLKDVTFRLAPVDQAEAERMIREIKGYPLLAGRRGSRAVDIPVLAQALAALSRFGAAHADDIAAIDINPFIAAPDGGCAVDALIVTRSVPRDSVAIREAASA
jgi:acyl-CoA synthetase (NDP forming)